MKTSTRILQFVILATALIGTMAAQTTIANIAEPIQPAADLSQVLTTAPYNIPPNQLIPFGIYRVTNGTPTLFAPLPVPDFQTENAIAIAPGFGGFTPGWVLAVYRTGAGVVNVAAISPGGASGLPSGACPNPLTGTNVSCILASNLGSTSFHFGATFDNVGLFGFNFIATSGDGKVFTVTSAGAVTSHQVLSAGTPTTVQIEGPAVAPANFGPNSGLIWLSGENPDAVFVIDTGFNLTQVTFSGATLNAGPEQIVFNGPLVCPILTGTGNNPTTLVDNLYIDHSIGTVEGFNFTQINTGFVNTEFGGTIYTITPTGGSPAYALTQVASGLNPGSTVNHGQEGMSTITIRTDLTCATQGCAFTKGYFRNHSSRGNPNVDGILGSGGMTLGTIHYTTAQIEAILAITGGNCGSNGATVNLYQQLITAKLNLLLGVHPVGAANITALNNAIAAANALIDSHNILTDCVDFGGDAAGPIINALDAFNEGQLGNCSQ
jgi:hypothetical protein